MTSINEIAARGFDRGAEAYARARPGYPREIVDAFTSVIAPEARVLDLAAGTGKLTRDLSDRGLKVLAAEPVEGMRLRFTQSLPEVPLVGASAEALPFRNSSLDAVVVAQAFHWFDATRALNEIRRSLTSHGVLAIIFNIRDDSVPWVGRLWEMLDSYDRDRKIPRHSDRSWEPTITSGFQMSGDVLQVAHSTSMDLDMLIARVQSVSFIASRLADEREHVSKRVSDFWRADPDLADRQTVDYPYLCELSLYRPLS